MHDQKEAQSPLHAPLDPARATSAGATRHGPDAQRRLVVAIPAYNEEVGIGSVILRALRHADEVVVVDDASTDSTARVAELAGARVVRHATNGGYGAALRTIFRTARKEKWDVLVILDSDGQHNPDDVPAVAGPVIAGDADVCIGSRFVDDGARRSIPGYREFGIRVLTHLNNVGADREQKVTDGQCGFRAYSRRAVSVIDPRDNDMGISAEILLQARKGGLTFREVPVAVRYDVDGSSQNPVKHGLGVIGSMIRYVELEHPLLFFALPGFLLLLTGVASGVLATSDYLTTGTLPVLLTMAAGALTLIGLLGSMTGLILHAVITATRLRDDAPVVDVEPTPATPGARSAKGAESA